MKTSYLARSGTKPGAILIVRRRPSNLFKEFPWYPALAPSKELLAKGLHKTDWPRYRGNFLHELRCLEEGAQWHWDALHEIALEAEPILMCYEKGVKRCHRGVVGEWFSMELQEVVVEVPDDQLALALGGFSS